MDRGGSIARRSSLCLLAAALWLGPAAAPARASDRARALQDYARILSKVQGKFGRPALQRMLERQAPFRLDVAEPGHWQRGLDRLAEKLGGDPDVLARLRRVIVGSEESRWEREHPALPPAILDFEDDRQIDGAALSADARLFALLSAGHVRGGLTDPVPGGRSAELPLRIVSRAGAREGSQGLRGGITQGQHPLVLFGTERPNEIGIHDPLRRQPDSVYAFPEDVQLHEQLVFQPQGDSVAFHPSGKPIHVFDPARREYFALPESTMNAQSFCFSPDGKRLGLLNWLGYLEIWDLATRERVWSKKTQREDALSSVSLGADTIAAITFYNRGKHKDELLVAWDLESRQEILRRNIPHELTPAVSPDARYYLQGKADRNGERREVTLGEDGRALIRYLPRSSGSFEVIPIRPDERLPEPRVVGTAPLTSWPSISPDGRYLLNRGVRRLQVIDLEPVISGDRGNCPRRGRL